MQFWTQNKKRSSKVKNQPREMNEINLDYTQTCARVGQLQYSMKSMEAQMQGLYARIEELQQEGNQRNLLDTTKKAAEEERVAKAGLQQAGG
jgi:hypothetical protein